MNPEDAVDLGREALRTCLMVGGPILVAGLLIGLAVGVLQAMTQVQDQTVSFVPKILLMLVLIGLALPWLSEQMLDFTRQSFESPAISLTGPATTFSSPTWNSKSPESEKWVEPRSPGQPGNDKVAAESHNSSMPMMDQPYSMPNLAGRPRISMPMMRSDQPQPSSPRMAETREGNRNE